jgi:hypothetical protein
MKKYRIAPDVREQIINRIKNERVTVASAAKDHGVSEATIHNWIGAKAEGGPSVIEFTKLKRENKSGGDEYTILYKKNRLHIGGVGKISQSSAQNTGRYLIHLPCPRFS